MNLKNSRGLVYLSAAIMAFGQNGFAQVAFPTVDPGSVGAGFYRPHSWIMSAAASASAVHGPGQSDCSSGCYYFPGDITTAYATTLIANGNGGQGMTVGIVDAYYNPQTESDLATFNSFFGLPACTTANGCLTIVNQTGGAPSAGFNVGWSQETDLDVQWVHAIAPKAKILLVTTTTNSFANLGTGVLYASSHADVVSNSYGSTEFSSESSIDVYYSGSTVPILASSGDTGAVVEYPCASVYVGCIGGTSLLETSTSHRNIESAWSGSGGGCSSYISVLAAQTPFTNAICGNKRGVPDISSLADPSTGAIVYLGSNAGGGSAGYYIFGGTSLACPITAALVAIIDTSRVAASKSKLGSNLNQLLYDAAVSPYYHYRYYDVTTGSSGFAATAGWDRATGLGVPLSASLANYLVSLP